MRSVLRGLLGVALVASAVVAVSSPASAAGDAEWEIRVFMCSSPSMPGCEKRTATGAQKRAVRTLLEGMPEVEEVRFVDQAGMYASFRRDFAANKPLLRQITAKDLLETFVLRLKEGADRDRVTRAVAGRPGVSWVIDAAEGRRDALSWTPDSDGNIILCSAGSAMVRCGKGRGKANKKAATAREQAAMAAALAKDPAVLSYVFEDQRTAYENFKDNFAGNDGMLRATRMSDMPESYRLTLRPDADWNTVTNRVARMPGVSWASNARCFETVAKLAWEYGLLDYSSAFADGSPDACRSGTG
ncbi:permease-like cell division protein FtsX [Nonomuraea bangladeshensis]|uniref:permease-like cell division protein FtsX n=1 Tax=Nonomuraea bangladeshensis TaxID=404385 RepID=UPI003C2AFD56